MGDLTIKAAHIPDPDRLSYTVEVYYKDRLVLTTPYSMGKAWCPGYNYKGTVPDKFRGHNYYSQTPEGRKYRTATPNERRKQFVDALTTFECQHGVAGRFTPWNGFEPKRPIQPILPELKDVMSCLLLDSDVLNYLSFEDWAYNFDYDPDSRKAEEIYRTCLAHALALKNTVPESVLEEFRDEDH